MLTDAGDVATVEAPNTKTSKDMTESSRWAAPSAPDQAAEARYRHAVFNDLETDFESEIMREHPMDAAVHMWEALTIHLPAMEARLAAAEARDAAKYEAQRLAFLAREAARRPRPVIGVTGLVKYLGGGYYGLLQGGRKHVDQSLTSADKGRTITLTR